MTRLNHLDRLEAQSIFILREAYYHFKNLCMLWSIGKDSTVLLWLARKAFMGRVPFPLVHIDTSFKIPEMIQFRDRLVRELKLDMIVGQNVQSLLDRQSYPDGTLSRIECCKRLKTEVLKDTLSGRFTRQRYDHHSQSYQTDQSKTRYDGVIVGVRADEEGSRSKERYFSSRDVESTWKVGDQAPEMWDQFNTEFPKGAHVRIHPLLEWTELNIWQYIEREQVSVVDLYFDRGEGKRYRSLGCYPCTEPVPSTSRNVAEIVAELTSGKLSNIAERSGRKQDVEGGGGLEKLRREGYM